MFLLLTCGIIVITRVMLLMLERGSRDDVSLQLVHCYTTVGVGISGYEWDGRGRYQWV